MRILLVEDDPVLSDGIQQALKQAGYAVDHARTGPDALHLLSCFHYDTAVLDLGLPGLDGLDVLRQTRQQKNYVPILILTARDTLEDRLSGLDLGADDYLAKPFKLLELEARIRALMRRRFFGNETQLTLGSLTFDTQGRRAYLAGIPLELSARETDVLELLLISKNSVISKSSFIEKLCGWQEDVTENAIEVYISRLRRKLEPSDIRLKNIRGVGYAIEVAHET